MYSVNGKEIKSFVVAIKEAQALNVCVIEIETGLNRWSPAPKTTAKKVRQYHERMGAFDAQKRQLSSDSDLIPYCEE